MADNTKQRPLDFGRRNYLILVSGLICIIVGVLLEHLDTQTAMLAQPQTWARVIHEIGFALIIGFIISFAIEQVSRREFHRAVEERIKEIQDNVFHATYGRNISQAMLNEVERLALGTDFLRHNHRITYWLERKHASELGPGLPDMDVIVTGVALSYDVENVSPSPKDFDVRLVAEKPPFELLGQFVEFQSVTINGREWSGQELLKCVTDSPANKEVNIIVPNVPKGDRVRVTATWIMLKLTTDVELWRSFLPSDGMTLCVHFPPNTVAKDANAIHRLPITPRAVGPIYCEWAIEGAVLPQQGILFWWRCAEPPKQIAGPPPHQPVPSTPPPSTVTTT